MIRRSAIQTALFLISATTLGCSSSKSSETPTNIVTAPTKAEEEVVRNAITAYDKGLYSVAEEAWTQLRDGFPTSYLQTLAELKIADAQFFRGEYPTAMISYQEFARAHPGHEAVPYVMFQIANCNLEQYRGTTHDQSPLIAAMKAFQELVNKHPSSEYVVLARRSIVECRERLAEHEKFVADFYERRGNADAAAKRRANLSTMYADTKSAIGIEVDRTVAQVPAKKRADLTLSPPELISGRASLPRTHSISQAALLPKVNPETTSALEDPQVSLPEVPVAAVAPFLGIECESLNGKPVFTVFTAKPFQRSMVEQESERRVRLDLVLSDTEDLDLSERDPVSAITTCQSEGYSLTKTSPAGGAETGQRFSLELEGKSAISYTLIPLSRPARVVIVISPNGDS